MPLSRRHFLIYAGATALAAVLPARFPDPTESPASEVLFGRALEAVPLRRWRADDAPVVRVLWPDDVVALWAQVGGWYGVPGGYVPCTAVCPMPGYDPAAVALPVERIPARIAVIAPIAVVRAWASETAPVIARRGYGNVCHVVDRLQDAAGALWYAVSRLPQDHPLGWTPAARWSAV